MRLFSRKDTQATAKQARRKPGLQVGYESDKVLARTARELGTDLGQLRLDPTLANGLDSPAVREIAQLGRARTTQRTRDGVKETGDLQKVSATAQERAEVATLHGAHLTTKLNRRQEVVVRTTEDLTASEAYLVELKASYYLLRQAERIGSALTRRKTELIAVGVSVCDAFCVAKPLESSGLASGWQLWAQIAMIAIAIFGTVNCLGEIAGKVALSFGQQRRDVGVFGLVVLGATLVGAFLLLGEARSAWTSQENHALVQAARGQGGVPQLLDPWFLSLIQIAAAGAVTAAIALFTMSESGRELKADIAEAKDEVARLKIDLKDAEAEVERVFDGIEASEVAEHQARIAGIEAEVDAETADAWWEAEREGEEALTAASVARMQSAFYRADAASANGKSRRAKKPDGWLKRLVMFPGSHVTDAGPAERAQPPGSGAIAGEWWADESDQSQVALRNGSEVQR